MAIKHALVVDDSKSARFSLKKLLQQQGIKTDFAESAGDALNYLSANNPDIIFMDHLMPGMDGFEATKAIKANPDTRDIPIIMCTSKEGTDYGEQALAIGAYAILPKPAPSATLMAILNQLDTNTGDSMQSASNENAAENKAPASSSAVGISTRVVESLVRKILDERFEAAQKSLVDAVREQLKQELQTDIEAAQQSLRQELTALSETRINQVSTTNSQKIAAALFDEKFEQVNRHVENRITSNLGALESALDATRRASPELIEEVKKIAQFTAAAAAGETAKEAAQEISRAVAQDVAQGEIANARDMLNEQQTQKGGGSNLLGIAGVVLGAIALLVALFT
ncbi:MAG TPA: response regulator [Dongiaceae bacterium]|nr:response regulator [Dongiaceae bacterium]